jgi:hypothetical protein
MDGHTFVFMILSITKEFVIIFSGLWKQRRSCRFLETKVRWLYCMSYILIQPFVLSPRLELYLTRWWSCQWQESKPRPSLQCDGYMDR